MSFANEAAEPLIKKMAATKMIPLGVQSRAFALCRSWLSDKSAQICYACVAERYYSPSSVNVMNIFDRKAKRHQRNVAAKMQDHHVYDYLKDEVIINAYKKRKV